MATYAELRSVFGDGDLQEKLEVAAVIAAQVILSGNDTDAPFDQTAGQHELRAKWAAQAISNTDTMAVRLLKLVLAANTDLTIVQIQGATDAAIQTNVNAVIDALATAQYGV